MSNAYQQLLATLGDVLKTLGTQPLSDEHVHAARKSIKKARAGLRLLREALGEDRYQRENAALRDAGRCLAPLRDATSLREALSAFREQYPARLRGIDFAALSRRYDANLLTKRREMKRSGALRTCQQSCAACGARVIAWKQGMLPANRAARFIDPNPGKS